MIFFFEVTDTLTNSIFLVKYVNNIFNHIQEIEALYTMLFSGLTVIISTVIYFWKYFKKKEIEKDLHPFYSKIDLEHHIRNYIPTKIQENSPSNFDEPNLSDASIKTFAIPFLISNFDSSNRYFMLLGDSGMGKTTLLFNLYYQYIRKFNRKYNIKLIPLGDEKCDIEVESLSSFEKRLTILLLDGFDEDTMARGDYHKRLDTIIKMSVEYRKVIITCRTQFFPSEDEEPKETGIRINSRDKGLMKFEKYHISPFGNLEINKYLKNKYSFFDYISKQKAKKIIRKIPNLMVRPLLLTYIDDLIELENYNYFYQIYEELVKKWVDRESNYNKLETEKWIYKMHLNRFSGEVALVMYNNLINNGSFLISVDEINKLILEYQIHLPLTDAKSRSLLNRNAQGAYKFAHKSIAEYFIALKLYADKDFRDSFLGNGLDMATLMFQEMKYVNETSEKIIKYIDNVRNTYQASFEIKCPNYIISSEVYFENHLAYNVFECYKISFVSAGLNDIQIFECFPKLKTLVLSYNKINLIDGMILYSLERLYLNNNGNLTIKNFNLPNLKYLDISNNTINDWSFIQNISKSIEWINLSQTNVNKKIIDKIKINFPKCQIALNHDDNIHRYPGYYFLIGPPNSNIKNPNHLSN